MRQIMEERKLTGNDLFEIVNDECERTWGNSENQGEGIKEVFYLGFSNRKLSLYIEKGWRNRKWKNKNVWKYEGKIKNELLNGQGKATTPDGKKYLGELKEWKHHCQGTFTTTDGERCSWEWNNGKRTCQGIETYSGGGKDEGEWKDGKPWNINRYDKNENIIGKSLMDKTITNQKYYQVKNS